MAEVMNIIYLVLLYVWYNISTEIKWVVRCIRIKN
jgi:hypothetical protein